MKSLITDAGHGDHDSGAVNGVTGDKEKDLALDFTQRFNRHYEVLTGKAPHTTRNTDKYLSLSARAAAANRKGAALLSFHLNASNKKGKGVEAFTTKGQTKSDPWATALLKAFCAENPTIAPRFDLRDGDPDKEASFTVLTKTQAEAVLFELGFIDNPEDIKYLANEAWRERNAYVLAYATAKHFGTLLAEVPEPVPEPSPAPVVSIPAIEEGPDAEEKLERDVDWQITKLMKYAPTDPVERADFESRLGNLKWLAIK